MIICYLPPIKGTRKLHWFIVPAKNTWYVFVSRYLLEHELFTERVKTSPYPPLEVVIYKKPREDLPTLRKYHGNPGFLHF